MANKTKIREVRIQVSPGVTLIADINDLADLKQLLTEIEAEGFQPSAHISEKNKPTKTKEKVPHEAQGDSDPGHAVEVRAGIATGTLKKSNVLAFKDQLPQLLRPGSFSTVSDATLSLLFSTEVGLKTSSISFEDFSALYDDQNIKSGSPLSMLLTNLKNAGYIDKRLYGADRTIRLTAKGEKKAIEVLKQLVSVS